MNKSLAWPLFPRLTSIVATVVVFITVGPVAVAQDEPAPANLQVATVLDRLATEPLTPQSYTSAVTLHVKLYVFPFIAMTLNGNSTYERPGIYKFSFHGFPLVARQFEKMDFNLGDPKAWPEKYDVTMRAHESSGEEVLRLTPKSSHTVKYIDITVDPAKGHIIKAEWARYDRGQLELTQHYAVVGSNEVVSQAEAQVAIGAIRAKLNIDFANFVVRGQAVATN